jgi:hypothetical protein
VCDENARTRAIKTCRIQEVRFCLSVQCSGLRPHHNQHPNTQTFRPSARLRIVKEQNRQVFQQSARHREPLLLAPGHHKPALTKRRPVPVGELYDLVLYLRLLHRRNHLFLAGAQLSVAHIMQDVGVEQRRILRDDGNCGK